MQANTRYPALLLAGLLLAGCGANAGPAAGTARLQSQGAPTGTLTAQVQWPTPLPPLRAQSLPSSTASVTFTVTGAGINPPVSASLTRNAAVATLMAQLTVPAGADRTLTVDAYNAANVKIATGSETGIAITGGTNNTVYVALGALNPPTISGMTNGTGVPQQSLAGVTVTISGGNFGAAQNDSLVTFNGFPALPTDVVSWGNAAIQVKVPVGATSGNVHVTVDGITSNPSAYSVDGQVTVTAS